MSKVFRVEIPFSGYCRGYSVHHIEAESEEDARLLIGTQVSEEEIIIRDDRTFEWGDAEVTNGD